MPAAPRPAERSWWLEEALARPEFAGPPAPPLSRDTVADVVILGGGYTGMWTAWFLMERDPGIDVVLLESDICGGGPRGATAGSATGGGATSATSPATFGDADALALLMTCGRSPSEIGAWCADHDVDAWFRAAATSRSPTNPRPTAGGGPPIEAERTLGVLDEYRELSADEVQARCALADVRRRHADRRRRATCTRPASREGCATC